MIRIGNQTSCWAATPSQPFDYALAQGFDAFEWFPDKKPGAGWDASDLDASARKRLRELAHENKISVSVHARWQEDLLAPESSPLVLEDLELARDLGAVLLNIHLAHEQGLAAFVKGIVPLLRHTAQAGLQLAIENTPHHAPEDFNELFDCLRAAEPGEANHVGMCLDLGHANLCAATRNNYLGFVDRLAPHVPIIHLHLHENWGDADTHLPLFTGPSAHDDAGIRGLAARLVRRNFSGLAILEQWPHPLSLLNNARDKLLEIWKAASETTRATVEAPPQTAPTGSGASVPRAGEGQGTPRRVSAVVAPTEPETKPGQVGHDLIAELAAGDQANRSWRQKLDFVRSLLARDKPALSTDDLADIAIYLRFLGTGELASSEDGRHFRPAHHARLSSQIQERLARLTTTDNAFIVRKIYPWLPSSSATFQRPEPLTRIRDIAHRNDIDSQLKREIKTTLQNKLHRCAGPEDLATATALLKRITAPGASYSPAFVEQFKIFYDELKEFFNARSLDERLAALASSVKPEQAELLELFLRQKAGETPADRLAAFRSLTRLREAFLQTIERNSEPRAQEFLLADIALEDFAFVLLSELINDGENSDTDSGWADQVEALVLALKNLSLSSVAPPESDAIAAELLAWGRVTASTGREELLRLKATVQRARRLAEDVGARTVGLFAERAKKLGRMLGVADHAVRVFSEADIRAHIIFQVSKLATSRLRRLRQRLGLPGWDVLVGGRAVGLAKTLDSLEQAGHGLEAPSVVLLKNAAGDEEIPSLVTGIVLAHELPHLSHLAVRARQAGTVFAACEESVEFERLQKFDGQLIAFQALPDQVTWETVAKPEPALGRLSRPTPRIHAARLDFERAVIPLEQAVAEVAGAKAAGARRLAELSRLDGAGFSTVPSLVIPFGVMEAQLNATPVLATEYRALLKRADEEPLEAFTDTTQKLRDLVQQLVVPDAIASEVARRFAKDSALVVRSSANGEDVEGMAGAGLYDSIINVLSADVAGAVRAVWSSLWTRRAALSRRQAGIPHDQAHMAVLIQEMVVPDFSFILHTVNPLSSRTNELLAEAVVGLGDTLASAATRGSPYRMICHKDSGEVTMLAFANFSQSSWPKPGGGLRRETVDYSRVALSSDARARQALGRRLAAIGRFVEQALQKPQDIEGAVAGDAIFLVQARPQPGL